MRSGSRFAVRIERHLADQIVLELEDRDAFQHRIQIIFGILF